MPNLNNWTVLAIVGLLLALAAAAAIFILRPAPSTSPQTTPVAEPNAPATLTPRVAGDGATTLSVPVMSYTPPKEGDVQAVVKVTNPETGEAQEVGRFTVFPKAPFQAPDPAGAMRFSFQLEEAVIGAAKDGRLSVIVELAPVGGGTMEGARMEFGEAILEAS